MSAILTLPRQDLKVSLRSLIQGCFPKRKTFLIPFQQTVSKTLSNESETNIIYSLDFRQIESELTRQGYNVLTRSIISLYSHGSVSDPYHEKHDKITLSIEGNMTYLRTHHENETISIGLINFPYKGPVCSVMRSASGFVYTHTPQDFYPSYLEVEFTIEPDQTEN